MPYRRLPKTDAARLKALRAVTESNVAYTVEGRFLNTEDLAQARQLCQELETASDQYSICMRTQVRYSKRIATLQHNVMMYLSHFLQVLFLAMERGEVEKNKLSLYGLEEMVVPYLKTPDAIMKWAPKIIEGEKNRLKKKGKPILSPPIGAVVTHFDVFKSMYDSQRQYQVRTKSALEQITNLRGKIDEVILRLWNQIEQQYAKEPPERRFAKCRQFGVIYYYRRHEERVY